MPQFLQSDVELSGKARLNLEAKRLSDASHENLRHLLRTLKPAATKSIYNARLIQRVTKDVAKSGVKIDANHIALDDTNAYRLLSAGDVVKFEWRDEDH